MLPAEAGTARTLVAGTEGDIVMPASPPPPPDLACRDASRPRVCEAALRSNCTDAATRSGCAKTCGLCTALVVPVQVATLIDGRLPIPVGADKVFLEVGSSDRNTLDTELLPAHPDGYLVTCEPLLDKYARALSRRAPQSEVFDLHEPLGQHHSRGLILPIAISPRPPAASRSEAAPPEVATLSGGAQTLKVGGSAGCSSLMEVHRGRRRQGASFGDWCNPIAEQRRVWSEPLEAVLQWVGRNVDFLKVDAQGLDLEVVRSGGARLAAVRRVSMEVVSDDCVPVYLQQPRCSEVVAAMAQLGYRPVSATPCTPPQRRLVPSHWCELNILFVQPTLPLASHEPYLSFHTIHTNGCAKETYTARTAAQTSRLAELAGGSDQVVATFGAIVLPGETRRSRLPAYVSRRWRGFSAHAHGATGYSCPQACFHLGNVSAELEDVRTFRRAQCPWY